MFFYYAYVSGEAGDTVKITESHTDNTTTNMNIQKLQAVLYSATCTKLTTLKVTDGNAEGKLPSDGLFIIGLKYNASSLKGAAPPTPPPATYFFDTLLNGITITQDSASIELNKK